MNRTVLPILSLLLASPLVFVGCHGSSEATAGGPAGPPEVGVAAPIVRQVTDHAEFTGRLSAVETVAVRARVGGFIDRIHFEEGELVEAGDLLVSLDARPFQADLSQRHAERAEAEVRLALAESEAARVEPLVDRRAVSIEEVEQRRRAVETARAELAAATARFDRARLDLEFTRVLAPVAGRVGRALVTRGNLIGGGGGDSTVLTTLVSLDPMYFYFTPDERTAQRLLEQAPGRELSVVLRLEGEGSTLEGRVDFFDNQVDPSTGTLQVRAVFPNPAGSLRPGMFGRLEAQLGESRPAILVPDAAVGRDQTQKILYVIDDDEIAQRQVVTIGRLVDGWRVIESGLSADDRVVVEGLLRVRPGSAVAPRLVTPEEPSISADGPPSGAPSVES